MAFLNPLFFLGSLALAVPILIHLVRRDKSEIVRFSSLMFLLRIPRKAIRQQRLRNLLLMALRLLLLALLISAFARPYLVESTAAVVPDGESRGVVLLLDNSYSMSYGTNFERMKNEAVQRIDGLREGDLAAVVAFSDRATLVAAPTDDANELKAAVEALESSPNGTSYYEAFALADRVLAQMDGYNRELVVISDFQRNGWNRPSRESVIDADVRAELVDLGVETSDNIGIDSVGVDATVFTRTYDGRLMARINNHHPVNPAAVTVALEINDRLVERKEAMIPPDASTLVEFSGFELPLGYARGRVRIEDADPLMIDNEFGFVVHRRDRLGLLIVDAGRPRQSFFLQQALTSAPDLPFAVEVRPANQLTPAEVEGADVVLVNDVAQLSAGIKSKLDEMRANGQGQLVFLAENADPDWWNTFEDLPVRLGDKVFVNRDRGKPFYSLTTHDRSHGIFAELEQSARLTLNTAQFAAFSATEPNPGAAVIAKFEDGSPAIVEAASDAGGLIVVTSSVDNRWNDLPVRPSFLPLVHEMVTYLAQYRESDAWYQLGSAVPVAASGEETVALITPDGERLTLGDASTDRFFTPELAGFYEVRVGREITHVAVNPPSSEGVLEKMPPDDLMASVKRLEGDERRGALLAEGAGTDHARRQNWWWYLFLFALLVGIGEIYLGNRVTEATRDQSPAVGIRS